MTASRSAKAEPATPAEPLMHVVRKKIEQLILTGEIAPGARLNELAIASRFKVSRSPVREAVRSLEQAGLVTVVQNKGVFVRRIALEEALDLYEIRAGLARSAGRLVASRIDGRELAALETIHEEMRRAMESGDNGAYYNLNLTFHDRMMGATQNGKLAELDETIRNQLQLYLRRGISGIAQMRVSHKEHDRVMTAFRAGDPEAAASALEAHVLSGKQRTLDNLRRDPSQDG